MHSNNCSRRYDGQNQTIICAEAASHISGCKMVAYFISALYENIPQPYHIYLDMSSVLATLLTKIIFVTLKYEL